MKKLHYRFDLQLFGDDGGFGGASASSGESSADTAGATTAESTQTELPLGIPEKARDIYEASVKNSGNVEPTATTDTSSTETSTPTEEIAPKDKEMSYEDLIKSDTYKKAHEQYMQKAIKSRLKGKDAEISRDNELLAIVATKYGLDTKSESFKDDLANALNDDDSIYERYADEHDMGISEAKKMVELERQVEASRQRDSEERQAQENAERISELKANAEETKKIFPNFDLESEIANPEFAKLCAALGGDTTKAFVAMHHQDIMSQTVSKATETAKRNVVNTVKSNLNRPSESNISSSHQSQTPDFEKMSLKDFRAYARNLKSQSRR